ncbi:MAG: alcohol dehydrogenase catalytic domain-containing protein [Candidatus Kariarchaeaceae archaeon]|jgi:6-hydroxycyclohex-1-ene-1-carbonyl-CoA dehydrogenase
MKAAVFTGDKKLVIEEREIPTIAENEILIKIVACGVCHTDEGYIEGTPTFKKLPIILGHEASGYVEKVGSRVDQFNEGDAVLIPPVLTCGECKYCLKERETLCSKQVMLGNHIDGAFAEYIALPAKDIIKVPKGLPLKEISIVADAVATPYHAVVERAKIEAGDKVAVIGCGGVGINVVQFAAFMGAEVIAIDLQQPKLELAKELGATYTINPNDADVKKEVRSLVGSVDVAFEVIGNPVTQQMAFDLLGPGGQLIVVGYSFKKWDGFFSGKVMFRELELIGSLGCPPRSFPRILQLIQAGKIKIDPLVTHRFKIEQINEAFDQLRKGDGIRVLIELE